MRYKEKDIIQLIVQNGRLVNYLIFGIGIILVVLAIILDTSKISGQIFLSVGTSIVASTIVVFLSSKYLFEQSKIKKVIEEWGLAGIYETRQKMNESSNDNLEANNECMDIIGFGLKGFRQYKGEEVKEKVKKGMKVRIITIDPNSEFLKEREIVEEENSGAIRNTILRLIEWVEAINSYATQGNKVEIRIYDSIPLDFYMRLDNSLYIGPYLYGLDSQQTISYEYKRPSRGYEYYSRYFEKLWNNDKFLRTPNIEEVKDGH